MAARPRILIGGVGYRFTRDLSFGPVVVDRLRAEVWPHGVDVEDVSFAPVAMVHRWVEVPYDRIVFVAAVPRTGRPPGTLCRYCPTAILPKPDEIQDRIGEALTGTISLDNLLVVTRQFHALPRDVEVIEVEPQDLGWGDGFSAPVRDAMRPAMDMIRGAVDGGAAFDQASVDALRRRDEMLQVLYWMEGEGLAADVRAADLLPFVGGAEAEIVAHLETLCRQGHIEVAGNAQGRYRLSVIGRSEGGRRFAEEFAPLLRQGHGECNDPDCDCHTTGDPAHCLHRAAVE